MKKTNDETSGRTIGYVRVSTRGQDQDATLQVDALLAVGCLKSLIFKDVASGAKAKRPGLDKCLETLREGDTLIVWRLDRLGRSLPHLVRMIDDLRQRGVEFRSLAEGLIDTTTASGELVFNLFCVLAQFELRLTEERTRAGLEAARARGREGGRRPIPLSDPRVQSALTLYDQKKLSVPAICKTLKISKTTLYRWIDLRKVANLTAPPTDDDLKQAS